MFPAQHELQGPAGQMQDSTGAAPPQHLQMHPGFHTHGQKTAAQLGMVRERLHPHRTAFVDRTEWNHEFLERFSLYLWGCDA